MVTAGQPSAPEYLPFDAILNRKERATYDGRPAEPLRCTRRLQRRRAARPSSMRGRRPSSRPDTCAARSTCRWTAGSPRPRAWSSTRTRRSSSWLPTATSEVVVRPARIGFDHVLGYVPEVDAVLAEVPEHLAQASRVTPVQLEAAFADGTEVTVLDLRNLGEPRGRLASGVAASRWPSCVAGSTRSRGTERSCSARAAGVRVSARATCAARVSRTSDILGGFSAREATCTPVEV